MKRKQRATPAIPRIFDGENEAPPIALAGSRPPKGHARRTQRFPENKPADLDIENLARVLAGGRQIPSQESGIAKFATKPPFRL